MRDKISAENLLHKIELFSKTSGLEVNRSKSECLLLSFEMNLNEYNEQFLGIPVVENLKVVPCQTVNLNSCDQYLKNIAADQIYSF